MKKKIRLTESQLNRVIRKSIKKALKNGEVVDGATLEVKENLQIK